MPKAVRQGDTGTDHAGFPPTPIIEGSSNVFIDGLPAARVGDSLMPHAKPNHPPHPRSISSGSSTVFINGKPAAITGGDVSCGGVTIGGGSVNIGDKFEPAFSSGISKANQQVSQVEEARVLVNEVTEPRMSSDNQVSNAHVDTKGSISSEVN